MTFDRPERFGPQEWAELRWGSLTLYCLRLRILAERLRFNWPINQRDAAFFAEVI